MFEFESKAALITDAHPKRGKSEDAHSYVVVRLDVTGLSAATMASAVGCQNAADVAALWMTDEEGRMSPRFLGVTHRTKYKAEGLHHIKFSSRSKIRVDRLFGVSFETGAAGLFDASFSVAIDTEDDATGLVEYLKGRINKTTTIALQCEGDDLFAPKVPPQADVKETIENGDLLDAQDRADKDRADAVGEAVEAAPKKRKPPPRTSRDGVKRKVRKKA